MEEEKNLPEPEVENEKISKTTPSEDILESEVKKEDDSPEERIIDDIKYLIYKKDGLVINAETGEKYGFIDERGEISIFTKEIEEEGEEEDILFMNDLYKKEINIGDIFLILYIIDYESFSPEITENICEIIEYNQDDNKILLKGDDLLINELELNSEGEIILQTENYKIVDIAKIDEIEEKELDKIELKLTKQVYQDIIFEDIITEDKNYKDNEKKEELISELIQLLNAYDNDSMIKEITDMCENFIKLIQTNLNNNVENKQYLNLHHRS